VIVWPSGVSPEIVLLIWVNVKFPVEVDRVQVPVMFANGVAVPPPPQPPRKRGTVAVKRIRKKYTD
jgi:hypothetical protein